MRRFFMAAAVLLLLAAPGRAQDSPPFLVEAAFDAPYVYAGQQVTYTLTAYSDTVRDVTFDLPALDGFWQADSRGFSGSATLDGKQYNVAIYQVSLYPQRTGTLDVAGTTVQFEQTVFSPGTTLISEPVSLDVLQPPPAPDDFAGLVGRVTMQFDAEPNVVELGEPVTVTLRLQGTANLALMPPPQIQTGDGWRLYTDSRTGATAFDGNLLTQTRELRWRAIPDRAGRSNLSVPPLIVFDPSTTEYVNVEVTPIDIEVLPGPNGELSRDAGRRTASSALTLVGGVRATDDMPPLLLWFIAPLAAGAVIGGRVGWRRWSEYRRERRKRMALSRAVTRLKAAAKQPDGLRAVGEAIHGYLCDSQRTFMNADLEALLLVLESERYHPEGVAQTPALAKQAADLLHRIESGRSDV